jgi:hypothetical protein
VVGKFAKNLTHSAVIRDHYVYSSLRESSTRRCLERWVLRSGSYVGGDSPAVVRELIVARWPRRDCPLLIEHADLKWRA